MLNARPNLGLMLIAEVPRSTGVACVIHATGRKRVSQQAASLHYRDPDTGKVGNVNCVDSGHVNLPN